MSNFTLNTTKHYFSTLLPSILQLFKMDRIDKQQAVFEQLTLSDFKKWSSTALKTFNNYTIKMTNNSYKITIS